MRTALDGKGAQVRYGRARTLSTRMPKRKSPKATLIMPPEPSRVATGPAASPLVGGAEESLRRARALQRGKHGQQARALSRVLGASMVGRHAPVQIARHRMPPASGARPRRGHRRVAGRLIITQKPLTGGTGAANATESAFRAAAALLGICVRPPAPSQHLQTAQERSVQSPEPPAPPTLPTRGKLMASRQNANMHRSPTRHNVIVLAVEARSRGACNHRCQDCVRFCSSLKSSLLALRGHRTLEPRPRPGPAPVPVTGAGTSSQT